MSMLSDYQRLVEKPRIDSLWARINAMSGEIDKLRAEREVVACTLAAIDKIVRTPTTGTAHKTAYSHYGKDFEDIRRLISDGTALLATDETGAA